MFDIGWMELLVIAVVAIVVVGPKDLPRLMRTFGHYAGKVRRMASDFQTQFDQAMTDAELEDMQRRYQEAIEMPERIKGPPMLPVPEEARAHPQNQPKAAETTATKRETAPAKAAAANDKPSPKTGKPSARSGTSKRQPASKAASGKTASQKAAPTGTSKTATGSKSAAARKASAKAASPSKSAVTPAPAAPKAPPKPGGAKRAASKTAKPRGGAKSDSARKPAGSKERSS